MTPKNPDMPPDAIEIFGVVLRREEPPRYNDVRFYNGDRGDLHLHVCYKVSTKTYCGSISWRYQRIWENLGAHPDRYSAGRVGGPEGAQKDLAKLVAHMESVLTDLARDLNRGGRAPASG